MYFQIHQVSLTMVNDAEECRSLSLARRPETIARFHVSAVPKPSQLLLGDINEKAAGHIWKVNEEYADWYTNEQTNLHDRGRWLARMIYTHHQGRASQFRTAPQDHETDKMFKDLAVKATCDYLDDWFNEIWPKNTTCGSRIMDRMGSRHRHQYQCQGRGLGQNCAPNCGKCFLCQDRLVIEDQIGLLGIAREG